jgi:formate hydrogenlyase subunit 6/NADH:ubiquinone oxidoreductase subunit I
VIESVFSTVVTYVRDALWGARSVVVSCATSIPYLFSTGENRKEVTEQYPDPISSRTADDLPPRTRGLLFNDVDRCTGCRECEKACPAHCIRIETESGADTSKLWIAVFDVDFAKCVYCGLCVEVCRPQSLVHTKQFEGSVYRVANLVAGFGRGHATREQREKWESMRQLAENDEVFL